MTPEELNQKLISLQSLSMSLVKNGFPMSDIQMIRDLKNEIAGEFRKLQAEIEHLKSSNQMLSEMADEITQRCK